MWSIAALSSRSGGGRRGGRGRGRGRGGDRLMPLQVKGDEWDLPSDEDLRGSPYLRLLAETLGLRRRVLRYNPYPAPYRRPQGEDRQELEERDKKRPRLASYDLLDAQGLRDAPLSNLLHWGGPALAIAIGSTVYVSLTAGPRGAKELFSLDEAAHGPLTCISWAPGGRRLAVASSTSREVQVWDPYAERLLSTVRGCTLRDEAVVDSMAWNNDDDGCLLTTGGTDSSICNIDLRAQPPAINRYPRARRGGQVCTLQWYAGVRLLSGEEDGAALVWDLRTSRSYLQRLRGHSGSVRAANWCPFDRNVLVTAGTGKPDGEDGTSSEINFWHCHDGSLVDAVSTSSGVWGLEWDEDRRELISAMGAGTLLSWGFSSRKMNHVTDNELSSQPIVHLTKSPNAGKLAAAQWNPLLPTVTLWSLQPRPSRTKVQAPSSSACSLYINILCYILDALSISFKQFQHHYCEVVVTYFFSMVLCS